MKLWAVEFGTFWLSEAANGPPPATLPEAKATFGETSPDDCLGAADRIVAYGWATRGLENVGELEREFQLKDDEVYIWDCGTVPAWRRQGCYTTLLNKMLRRFHEEGIPRIWIDASRRNQPSIQGIVRAGFQHVMDMTYRRLWVATFLQFRESLSASPSQIAAAYRILTGRGETRLGRIAIGIYRDGI